MFKKRTQKERILKHLKKKPITPLKALNKYDCFRLSSIIHRLRTEGWDIKTLPTGKKQYATYKLIK